MKISRLFALPFAFFLLPAQAAVYNITASFHDFTFINAPDNPYPVTIYSKYTPATPTATGVWNIETDTPAVTGNLDYEPFSQQMQVFYYPPSGDPNLPLNLGTLSLVFPHAQSDVAGNTGSYDATSRTLTLTGVTLHDTGEWATCTSTGYVTCSPPGSIDSNGSSSMVMALTFDESLHSFTGVGTLTYAMNDGSADIVSWNFSGTEVPVPAAGWLFISGLAGLAVSKRRKI